MGKIFKIAYDCKNNGLDYIQVTCKEENVEDFCTQIMRDKWVWVDDQGKLRCLNTQYIIYFEIS